MKIAYLHYLYGKQTGLHHVRQFSAAARGLGHDIEIYPMHPFEAARSNGDSEGIGEGGTPSPRPHGAIKRLLSPYLHDPKEFLLTIPYASREIALLKQARPDVLLVRDTYLNLSNLLVARKLGLPLVFEVNAPTLELIDYPDPYKHSAWLLNQTEKMKLKRADGVTVVSSWLKSHLVERHGVSADKITVNPNGADMEKFRPDVQRDSEVPEDFWKGPVVGFVGSFHPWHGPGMLGRMAVRVSMARPETRFLFIGAGSEVETVKKIVAPLGDRALFLGRVDHGRIPGLVAGFDIGVTAESMPYASPLKVFEWMAASRAIVAPSYEPVVEIIDHEVDGLLFPPGDEEAFARQIICLIDDPELRERLGRAAYQRVQKSLTWEDNARRALEACEKARQARLSRYRLS